MIELNLSILLVDFFFNRSLVSKYFICIRNPWEQNCNQSEEIFLEHLLLNEYFSDTSNGKQKIGT